LAISRGGLMSFNWAAENPEAAGCIGAIYPLCNLEKYSRPGRIARAYNLSEAGLREQIAQHNPVDRLQPLAKQSVPLFLIHGDADDVVPVEYHSGELARRYRALEGPVRLVIVPDKGHEVVPEYWQEEKLIHFFVTHLLDP
jgi:dipeptidyl aminopeptidase/acylaminoacyl peptidase